ncbi:MAG: leucine-rich repeat protein [Endozoicomonadaceae bacterium]|nr:leucine-rich repeat protein [Endozoicomonadaceae bacterium]
MDHSVVNFSAKGACSYVWNKNCANGDSKVVNFFKCLATLIRTVFDKYQVEECLVEKIYSQDKKTIFGEEYKKQLNDRKVEELSNTMPVDFNNNTMPVDFNNNTVAVVNENNKHDTASSVNNCNSLSGFSKIKAQDISAVDLKRLIKDGDVLPDIHYVVQEDISFDEDCDMTELPDNITIEGNLEFYKCKNLKHLPDNLRLSGSLNLYECSSLVAVPEYLDNFGGFLMLCLCTSLTSVPKKIKALGDVVFDGCSELIIPPEDIHTDGNITFTRCSKLKQLPQKIYAGKDLITDMSMPPKSANVIVKGNCRDA